MGGGKDMGEAVAVGGEDRGEDGREGVVGQGGGEDAGAVGRIEGDVGELDGGGLADFPREGAVDGEGEAEPAEDIGVGGVVGDHDEDVKLLL